jgi:two-component system, response regulator PdtaR
MESARVLVVEDEKILALGMKKKLEKMGHIVVDIVDTGEKSVKSAQKYLPDIILMDIVLKGDMDGIEAAKIIRKKIKIPIIYLTAYADEEIIKRARITEPYAYIVKPYKTDELNANIQMAIYKHHLSQKESEKVKKKIMNDFYDFLGNPLSGSISQNETEIRYVLLQRFAQRFENDSKPGFIKTQQENGINDSSSGGKIFETYLFWIMNHLTDIGIKTGFTDNKSQLFLEFENCPWLEESYKNPLFCLNCEIMINKSFEWTNLEGKIKTLDTIAHGSKKCVVSFNF